MKIINQIQHNIRHIVLAGSVAAVIVTGLVGCGGTTTTSTSDPTATTAASSDVSTIALDTPVADAGSMAAPTQAMGASDQAVPTQPSIGTSDQATPAQPSTGQVDTGGSSNSTQINAVLKEWALDLS